MISVRRCPALSRSYPAVPESVPQARHDLAQFAVRMGAAEEQVEAVRLAASEAMTNVVMHAYEGPPGEIHLTSELAAGELWVLVGDDGTGLRTNTDSPGLGVGLALIAKASDGMTIMARGGGGTELRMRFSLEEETGGRDQPRGSRSSAAVPAAPRFSTTT